MKSKRAIDGFIFKNGEKTKSRDAVEDMKLIGEEEQLKIKITLEINFIRINHYIYTVVDLQNYFSYTINLIHTMLDCVHLFLG